MTNLSMHHALWPELSTDQLFDIVLLRYRVFALEQRVEEEEFDHVDRQFDTEHWWFAQPDGAVVAYLRAFPAPAGEPQPEGRSPAGWLIGRMAVDPSHRGLGLAQQLIGAAVAAHPGEAFILHSQTYITSLYEKCGFRAFGQEYEEAKIPHISMYRAAD